MNVLTQLISDLDELLVRIRPSMAIVGDKRGSGAGAGILVGDGLVLTNHHVARHGHSLQVILEDDESFDARVVASDPNVDLALLEIQWSPLTGTGEPEHVHGHGYWSRQTAFHAHASPKVYKAAVISTEKPRPGEMVFAFGHPWGERNVLTGGVLSAVTSARSRKGEVPILRADVQLAPGNSGGPLLNSAGEVIGINAMIFGGDQSVAIPASVIREFLEAAQKNMPGRQPAEAVI